MSGWRRGIWPGLGTLLLALLVNAVGTSPLSGQSSPSVFSFLSTDGRGVGIGSSAAGALTEADALTGEGRRVQAWVLEGILPGDRVVVDLTSDDFDAFLYLVGPGLAEGLRDDDGGNGLDSRLCFEAEADGEYRIIAASLGGNTGGFTLTVTEDPAGTCQGVGDVDAVTEYADLPWDDRLIGIDDFAADNLDDTYDFFGNPVEAWGLQGQAGQTVTIDLRSDAFDALLTVLGPGLEEEGLWDDDSGGSCDARVEVTFAANAVYTVVVESYGGLGDYTLRVSTDPEPATPGCLGTGSGTGPMPSGGAVMFEGSGVGSAAFVSVPLTGSVPEDGVVAGATNGGEADIGARRVQAWGFEVGAGERFAVSLQSEDFDAYLYLMGPGFPDALSDDDGGTGLNSMICYQADGGGSFIAYPSAFSEEDFAPGNSFRLQVSRGADADALCGEAYTLSPAASAALGAEEMSRLPIMGELPFEGTVQGQFTGEEIELSFVSRPVQGWTLIASSGERVSITLRSDDFDPYLYLAGPGFLDPVGDDDGAGSLDSRICVQVSESAEYLVLPAAYGSPTPGDRFELSVVRGEAAVAECQGEFSLSPAEEAELAAREQRELYELDTAGRSLGAESSGTGFIDGSQVVPGTDDWVQAWELTAEPGTVVFVDLESPDFDTFLRAVSPLMEEVSNDDFGESLNSRVTLTIPGDGRVLILAGSFGGQVTGSYTLTTSLSPRATPGGTSSGAPARLTTDELPADPALSYEGVLPAGAEYTGYLSGAESLLINGRPAQAFQVQVPAGATVAFEVSSGEFDTYMYVRGPGLDGALFDDDGGEGFNSRIEVERVAGGVYTVFVRSLSSGSSGPFQLRTLQIVR